MGVKEAKSAENEARKAARDEKVLELESERDQAVAMKDSIEESLRSGVRPPAAVGPVRLRSEIQSVGLTIAIGNATLAELQLQNAKLDRLADLLEELLLV